MAPRTRARRAAILLLCLRFTDHRLEQSFGSTSKSHRSVVRTRVGISPKASKGTNLVGHLDGSQSHIPRGPGSTGSGTQVFGSGAEDAGLNNARCNNEGSCLDAKGENERGASKGCKGIREMNEKDVAKQEDHQCNKGLCSEEDRVFGLVRDTRHDEYYVSCSRKLVGGTNCLTQRQQPQ